MMVLYTDGNNLYEIIGWQDGLLMMSDVNDGYCTLVSKDEFEKEWEVYGIND